MLGKTVWAIPASRKSKPIYGIAFAHGLGCTCCWVQKNWEVLWGLPKGTWCWVWIAKDFNCTMLIAIWYYVITTVVVTCHIDGSALRPTQINAAGNLVEASKVRLWGDENWLQHAPHTTSPPWTTALTDRAWSHGLNKRGGLFRGMVHRIRELHLCLCLYIF